MRSIASNIKAPAHKIAKWVIEQFNSLEPPPNLSVTDSKHRRETCSE